MTPKRQRAENAAGKSKRGGKRAGAGRPRSDDPTLGKRCNLTAREWAYLDLWHPGASTSEQLRELLERARKFWPGGPGVFR